MRAKVQQGRVHLVPRTPRCLRPDGLLASYIHYRVSDLEHKGKMLLDAPVRPRWSVRGQKFVKIKYLAYVFEFYKTVTEHVDTELCVCALKLH